MFDTANSMFSPTSRYYTIDTAMIEVPRGSGIPQTVRYIRRRFISSDTTAPILVEHTVQQGDRLDNIAALYLGDPTQFWQICDTNCVLDPDELMVPGRMITITLPHL